MSSIRFFVYLFIFEHDLISIKRFLLHITSLIFIEFKKKKKNDYYLNNILDKI